MSELRFARLLAAGVLGVSINAACVSEDPSPTVNPSQATEQVKPGFKLHASERHRVQLAIPQTWHSSEDESLLWISESRPHNNIRPGGLTLRTLSTLQGEKIDDTHVQMLADARIEGILNAYTINSGAVAHEVVIEPDVRQKTIELGKAKAIRIDYEAQPAPSAYYTNGVFGAIIITRRDNNLLDISFEADATEKDRMLPIQEAMLASITFTE